MDLLLEAGDQFAVGGHQRLFGFDLRHETAAELHDWFPTEQACRDYLARLRWPAGVVCPDCKAAEVWSMTPPFHRCARCSYDFTVTAGILFANTRKPLRLWFETIWYISHQKSDASALDVQRILGSGSYRTA